MNKSDRDVLTRLTDQEGAIVLGPRPGKKSLKMLAEMELTHCCTLLSEREDVSPIRKISQNLACEWIWLPIGGGRLEILEEVDLKACFQTLAKAVAERPDPRVYFHCSAGIHRTGFFVYALLKLCGLERGAARTRLAELRTVTAEQVGEERLDLADRLVQNLQSPGT